MKLQLGFSGERFLYFPQDLSSQFYKNPLFKDLYITLMGYFNHAEHHFINRDEGNIDFILIYCIDGVGNISINGEEYKMQKNQFIIFPPNIAHKYLADKKNPWSIYWIHFNGTKAPLLSKNFDKPTDLSQTQLHKQDSILSIFEDIYQTLSSGIEQEHLIYANLSFNHLLANFICQNIEYKNQVYSEYKNSIINKAVIYMHENVYRNITISEVAIFIGYSPSYFYRRFIEQTKLSPINYLIKIKMEKACELLTSTNLQINQIAAKLGYKDSLYFSRIFTKQIGISPKKYRSTNAKEII